MPRIIAQNRIPRVSIASRNINQRGQQVGAVTYQAIATYAPALALSPVVTFGPDAKAGDLVFVSAATGGNTSTAPAGWNAFPVIFMAVYNYKCTAYWKVLTQADIIAGSQTFTNVGNDGPMLGMCYRGVSSIRAVSAFNQSGQTTMVLPAFNKAGKVFIAVVQSRDAATTPQPPYIWRVRTGILAGANFNGRLDELPVQQYDGLDVIYTGIGATTTVGNVYELS